MKELLKAVNRFRDERNWRRFHKAKDLSLSISLEAAELLEHFQWIDSEEAIENDKEGIGEEIADVMIYSMMLADDLEFDLEEIILAKLEKNKEKYPLKESKKYDD